MADTLKPRDAKEVEEAVCWALGNDKPLEVVGQGTKRTVGRPSQTDLTLDLSSLTGVTLYEPAELVLSARAGTPIAEIEALLEKNNQELAFEPMDYGRLLGERRGPRHARRRHRCEFFGPAPIKVGAARDHFLGFTAVTGRAETIKSGGRVVKNVTGDDLCKVLAGSWGTLGAMTDITVKVLPKAETEATVLIAGLDDARACAAMAAATGSSCDVSGAAHLPDHVASWFDGLPNPEASTVLRLEGFTPSVTRRKNPHWVDEKFWPGGDTRRKGLADALAWHPAREAIRRGGHACAATLAYFPLHQAVAMRLPPVSRRRHRCSTTGPAGLFGWRCLLPMSLTLRRSAAQRRRWADTQRSIRAPAAVRAVVDVFAPEEAALHALSKRVKESFDPKGVLNPGRMWAGV